MAGWSHTAFGPRYTLGFDNRVPDATVPRTFIEGGFADQDGRTDHAIIADFARALATDPEASAMLRNVARRYVVRFRLAPSGNDQVKQPTSQ